MKARVNVVMVTHNHENFVQEAIESVLMQVCAFPVRLIIADDCSTDQTGRICEEYAVKFPDCITFIRQQLNVGLVKNYDTAFKACDAEFIAILEGDDVWTEP